LKEDDPNAVTVMLDFAYYNSIPLPDKRCGFVGKIRYIISLYSVADKYDFPSFQESLANDFNCEVLNRLMRSAESASKDESIVAELCSIVKDIYNLVGPDPRPEHPYVHGLLTVLDQKDEDENEDGDGILNSTGGDRLLLTSAS
jgi:hypothetical protein